MSLYPGDSPDNPNGHIENPVVVQPGIAAGAPTTHWYLWPLYLAKRLGYKTPENSYFADPAVVYGGWIVTLLLVVWLIRKLK